MTTLNLHFQPHRRQALPVQKYPSHRLSDPTIARATNKNHENTTLPIDVASYKCTLTRREDLRIQSCVTHQPTHSNPLVKAQAPIFPRCSMRTFKCRSQSSEQHNPRPRPAIRHTCTSEPLSTQNKIITSGPSIFLTSPTRACALSVYLLKRA